MKYTALFFVIVGFLTITLSCSSNSGNDYIPIDTSTVDDIAETNQNSSALIAVLDNDTNVPSDGILTVTQPQHGFVEIQTNNTATILDDAVLYTPSFDYVGPDTFTYKICSATNQQDCVQETVSVNVLPVSPVVFDLNNMPYTNLSDYNFFSGNMADQEPVYGVIPYEPITPLFVDYAHKKRFVWMPQGQAANYVSDHEVLDFPIGTILIKTFYYDEVQPNNTRRLIETRLMIRKETEWIFADYVWNTDQTEAVFDNNGSYTFVEWNQNGQTLSANYRIPSETECHTCHKKGETPTPIGPKPQNINKVFDYADGSSNELEKLEAFGYLNPGYPSDITTVVDWEDPSQPLNLRVRSYFDMNCAHCHSDNAHCDYMSMRFAFNESADEANLGVCITPQENVNSALSHIVKPGNTGRSALYYRINTNQEDIRMPLLGRSIIHEEGVALIEEWINSLTTNCN